MSKTSASSLSVPGRAIAAVALAFLTEPVLAHPGDHGSSWLEAAMHVLTEPDHLFGIAIAFGVALWFARAAYRRRNERRAQSRRQP